MDTQRRERQKNSPVVLPRTIIKRNGAEVSFDLTRVERAIEKCYSRIENTPVFTPDEVSAKVGATVSQKFGGTVPSVEDIQDVVETTLIALGETEAAREYIHHRIDRTNAREERVRPRITTPKEAYVFDYDAPGEFVEQQQSVLWTADEINVENDVQDLKINLTPAERHGVITTLKLFTLYECLIGGEVWGGRIRTSFPRPEIEMMASLFSYVELGIHAPFYNKLNEAAMLNTEDFYTSYIDDPQLKDRIDFVNASATDPDLGYFLAVFSLMEGAVLYSSFAFFKHFQAQGKNKLSAVCRGINFSVRDENLHSEAGAWLYRTYTQELMMKEQTKNALETRIKEAAKHVYEHEVRIIDMIFEHGDIEGLDAEEMKTFVASRINLCLGNLGLDPVFEIEANPVADWFYDNIANYQFGDFFQGTGSEYNRSWDEEKFAW